MAQAVSGSPGSAEKASSVNFWAHIVDIGINPEQCREEFQSESLQGLADSIREKGQKTPVWVFRVAACEDASVRKDYEGHTWGLIGGERRLRAVRDLLRRDQILATEMRIQDRADLIDLTGLENIGREALRYIEEAVMLAKMLYARPGRTYADLARMTGISMNTIQSRFKLLQLEDSVGRDVRAGRIRVHTAGRIAKINKDQQRAVADHIIRMKLDTTQAAIYLRGLERDSAVELQTTGRKRRPSDDRDNLRTRFRGFGRDAGEYATMQPEQIRALYAQSKTEEARRDAAELLSHLVVGVKTVGRVARCGGPVSQAEVVVALLQTAAEIAATMEPKTVSAAFKEHEEDADRLYRAGAAAVRACADRALTPMRKALPEPAIS